MPKAKAGGPAGPLGLKLEGKSVDDRVTLIRATLNAVQVCVPPLWLALGRVAPFLPLGAELKKELNGIANLKLDLGADTLHMASLDNGKTDLDACWERQGSGL